MSRPKHVCTMLIRNTDGTWVRVNAGDVIDLVVPVSVDHDGKTATAVTGALTLMVSLETAPDDKETS